MKWRFISKFLIVSLQKKSNILSRKQQSFLFKLIYDNNGYLFYHVKKD